MELDAIAVDSTALLRDQAIGTGSGVASMHVSLSASLVPESIEGSQNKKELASETDKKGK